MVSAKVIADLSVRITADLSAHISADLSADLGAYVIADPSAETVRLDFCGVKQVGGPLSTCFAGRGFRRRSARPCLVLS